MNLYTSVPTVQKKEYDGRYAHSTGAASWFEGMGFARTESMDITNDPRFFTDNVINYRLAAFNGLGVVSGFMIGNAMGQVMDMNKQLDLWHGKHPEFDWNGCLLLVSFLINTYIFLAMVSATFIGVLQPYHTYKLMTAGPRGFETCAAYYLSSDIVWYRHAVIRAMLYSLPAYLIQMGLRMTVKFDVDVRAGDDLPATTPLISQVEGIVAASIFGCSGFYLLMCYWKHDDVFKGQYRSISQPISEMQQYMSGMMQPRSHRKGNAFSSWFGVPDGPDV